MQLRTLYAYASEKNAQRLEDFEAGNVGQPQVQHHAVERPAA